MDNKIFNIGTKVRFFIPHENKWFTGEIRSYTPNNREVEVIVNNYPRRLDVKTTRIEEVKKKKS